MSDIVKTFSKEVVKVARSTSFLSSNQITWKVIVEWRRLLGGGGGGNVLCVVSNVVFRRPWGDQFSAEHLVN